MSKKRREGAFVKTDETGGVDVKLPLQIVTANVARGQVSGPRVGHFGAGFSLIAPGRLHRPDLRQSQ